MIEMINRITQAPALLLKYLLPAVGLAILVAYKLCPGECAYLTGQFIGIDLTIMGGGLMVTYLVLLLTQQQQWAFRLMALATGGEVFLIGYQVVNQVFCPYCLGFAAVVIVLFALHIPQMKKILTPILMVLGFVALMIGFTGQLFPAYSASGPSMMKLMPEYGDGPVEVRLYTDYFCGPCNALEQELESMLPQLMAGNKVKLVLVDTPMYKYSSLYARSFLTSLAAAGNSFEEARKLKKIHFNAAQKKVHGESELKSYLEKAGVKQLEIDVMPVFQRYSEMLKEDHVNSTPRMVVIKNGQKESFRGSGNIYQQLKKMI